MAELYIGLISGTSMDGIDAALVDLSDTRRPRTLATHAQPLEDMLRDELLSLAQGQAGVALGKLGELDQRMGLLFAEAANALLAQASVAADEVRAIGSHGQTLHHAPNAPYPFSTQIGDPNLIAARTGITTVADFRRRDMAAGGQGAPLVPAFHNALFAAEQESRCIVNIGGIANITLLPAKGSGTVSGFDTGPGNALMDAWIRAHLGEPFDRNGRWASQAHVDEGLLQTLMRDPFFHRPPPKSTGREYFNIPWLRSQLAAFSRPPAPAVVQRTLCELTTRAIAMALAGSGPGNERVLLCGGGAHNPVLRDALEQALAPRPVEDTTAYGLDVDNVEACAFAWLAMRTVNGLSGNLPAATGAHEPVVLGGIYPGKSGRSLNDQPPGE